MVKKVKKVKKITCDRCKTKMDHKGLPIDFAGTVKRWDDHIGGRFSVNLCYKCVDNLEDWFNGKPANVKIRPTLDIGY